VSAALDIAPIDGFVSYDERQSAAARLAGLRTVAPAGAPTPPDDDDGNTPEPHDQQ
jgi:hypothetical protein